MEKNMFERGDLIKGGQSSFSTKISHQQNWWIVHTNVIVIKKKTALSIFNSNELLKHLQ